jgi:DNA-binding CsgD family transcriptional regulator
MDSKVHGSARRPVATALTPRQQEVLDLLAAGLSIRDIAERLSMSVSTVGKHRTELLARLKLYTTTQLRIHGQLNSIAQPPAPTTHAAATRNLLRSQARLLPDMALNLRAALGARCVAAGINARRLRDVADCLRDGNSDPGDRPDSLEEILNRRGGTLGAQQALLVALAHEGGRRDIELIVGCGEVEIAWTAEQVGLPSGRARRTLPLAVCYLRYRGHRLQITAPGSGSMLTAPPHSETAVEPLRLPEQRLRLYREYAADWCRVFELRPQQFAPLRAAALQHARGTALYEDLLGHSLAAGFEPAL